MPRRKVTDAELRRAEAAAEIVKAARKWCRNDILGAGQGLIDALRDSVLRFEALIESDSGPSALVVGRPVVLSDPEIDGELRRVP